MAIKSKTTESLEISVLDISQGKIEFCILGNSPLIFNAMSAKAKHELLLPKGRKTAADKAANLKHIPIDEYRNSTYRSTDSKALTRLMFPAPGFKRAMATAALDLPGAKRTEIGRLTWVEGQQIGIYGVPKLLMSVVRSADIAKTPDIRTRAILPQWACSIVVNFVRPKLQPGAVSKLLAAAGITVGVGDFRQEKGAGSFGQFRLVEPDNPDFKRILKEGGRVAQDEALKNPECYDLESEELLGWYNEEIARMQDTRSVSRKPQLEEA
jgi:hypothetical protein